MKNISGKSFKKSRYNIYCENGPKTILYNSASGSVIKLTSEFVDKVKDLINDPNDSGIRNDEIFDTLIENKFIVDNDFNEVDFVKVRLTKSKYQVDKLIFTIIPNMTCNFKCSYCFEESTSACMSEYDYENTLQFIKQQVEAMKPALVTVVWFGGEPLLSLPMIEKISNAISSICSERSIKLAFSIITNGYLLDEKTAAILRKCNIKSLQITLDGNERMHNTRRIHKSGKTTFQEIKKAIILSKNVFDNVMVRFNVDENNADDLMELLDEQWLYGDNIHVAAGHLENFNDSCSGKKDIKILNLDEYYPIARALNKKYQKNSGKSRVTVKELIDSLPVKSTYCGASNVGQWVIGPGSSIYKCLSSVDEGSSCGYLYKGILIPKNNLNKWLLEDPITNRLCMECNIFPICLGGCPKAKELYPNPDDAGLCRFWHKYTYDTLKDITELM